MRRCATLLRNCWRDVGLILYEAHESLKNLFEASCAELDAAVDASRKVEGHCGLSHGGGRVRRGRSRSARRAQIQTYRGGLARLYCGWKKGAAFWSWSRGGRRCVRWRAVVSIDKLWATSGEGGGGAAFEAREPSDFCGASRRGHRKTASTPCDGGVRARPAELAKEDQRPFLLTRGRTTPRWPFSLHRNVRARVPSRISRARERLL